MVRRFERWDKHLLAGTRDALGTATGADPSPMLAALSSFATCGSCALTIIIDVANDRMYVANLGDSRAVAGWWSEKEWKWRCDILTNDLEGENTAEADRSVTCTH